MHEVDIEDNDNYLQEVIDIVRKQRKILLVAPYELRGEAKKIKQFLTQYDLQVESFIEEGDIHTDLQNNMGQNTKEIVKGIIQDLAKKSGMIVLLTSEDLAPSTILQMAYSFGKHHNCFIKSFPISNLDENQLKQIYANLIELINS